jgi:hypothetical protein
MRQPYGNSSRFFFPARYGNVSNNSKHAPWSIIKAGKSAKVPEFVFDTLCMRLKHNQMHICVKDLFLPDKKLIPYKDGVRIEVILICAESNREPFKDGFA